MPQLTADVYARIDPKTLDASAAESQKKIQKWATASGTDWTKAFHNAAKADPQTPDNSVRARLSGARDGRAYGAGFNRAANSEIDGVGKRIEKVTSGLDKLGSAAGSFAIAGIAPVLVGVAGAAVTAVGALGLIPGAALGAGAAIGSLVVGMHGFGDAIKDMGDPKKFAQDLQSLSPAAQQAALEIQNLVQGPLGALKRATQESLFSGMAKEIHDLTNTLLPTLQSTMTGVAGAFNSTLKSIGGQLMSPDTSAALAETMRNVVSGFQQLAPAAGSFTKAMVDIAQAGSQFWPGFAADISNAASQFANLVRNASQSGQLHTWIQQGVDAAKEFGKILADAGRIMLDLAPIGSQVLPPIEHVLHDIADLLREHPNLIYGVVGAFAAWKTIEGVSSLITSLTTISTALKGLPALASSAAGGISTALAGVSIPAWMKWIGPAGVGLQSDVKNSTDVGLPDVKYGPDGKPYIVQQWNGGGGSFAPPPPPGTGNGPHGRDGYRLIRDGGLPAYSPFAVPAPPADGAAKKPDLPVVGTAGDPMSLLQGYQVTSSLYSAASSVMDARTKLAQSESDLNTLLKSNTATADEIQKARNDHAKAEQDELQAELRLNEAKAAATKKSITGFHDASAMFGEIGANLDKDLGLSKGLPGLADNLVKFLASLAAAPVMGALAPIAAQGDPKSYGLMGMMFGGSQASQYPTATDMVGSPAASAPTPIGPIGNDKASIAQAIYGAFTRAGYSPQAATGVVQAGLLESGLNPAAMNSSGHNSIFQTSADKGIGSDPASQIQWALAEAARQGGPAAMNADPLNFWANRVERGGYPGSNYNQFLGQAQGLIGGGGGGPGMGMPQGLGLGTLANGPGPLGASAGLPVGSPYQAQGIQQQAPGWQPNGGGGLGIGGLAGGAIQAAISAAGTAGAPFGGQAAAAAAQMGMQLINRTIAFGGQLAGIGAEGILDTFFPTDPDTGKNPMKDSWLWRAAGALAGAAPAIGSGGAGLLDKHGDQKLQGDSNPQGQQSNQQQNQQGGPLVHIENNYQNPGQSAKSMGQDIAHQLTNAGIDATMPRP